MAEDYEKKVEEAAWDAVYELEDEIVSELESGDAEDDIGNERIYGDYGFETWMQDSYDLKDAAELLDQLDEHEETDEGLWDGQSPREAIGTQAAYTYRNACTHEFKRVIGVINDYFNGVDDDLPPGWREAYPKMALPVLVWAERFDPQGEDTDIVGLAASIASDFHGGNDITAKVAGLLDHYEGLGQPRAEWREAFDKWTSWLDEKAAEEEPEEEEDAEDVGVID